MKLVRFSLAACVALGVLACDDSEDPTTGGGMMSGGGGGGSCTASLKTCAYDEMETACSSLMTPEIPLRGGGTWGNTELKLGPYGAYVEWNAGRAFATNPNVLEATCDVAAATFGEPASVTNDILDLRGQDLTLYTVFRPACMRDGEKYPVITWGNGTCGQAGGYASLLAAVASHGFVVVAPNSRWVGSGAPLLKGLDFMAAENADPSSVFYQKLDLDNIGAMGHSQGGAATVAAARDPRIDAVILWNGGGSAVKPFLAVSGDQDIMGATPRNMANTTARAAQPGAWLYYHQILNTGGWATGHLTLMEQPERVTDAAIAWWKYMLKGDQQARSMFVGNNCGLCNNPAAYEYGQSKLP